MSHKLNLNTHVIGKGYWLDPNTVVPTFYVPHDLNQRYERALLEIFRTLAEADIADILPDLQASAHIHLQYCKCKIMYLSYESTRYYNCSNRVKALICLHTGDMFLYNPLTFSSIKPH